VAIYLKRSDYGFNWNNSIDSDYMVLGSATIESPGISIWEMKNNLLTPFRTEKLFWRELLDLGWYNLRTNHEISCTKTVMKFIAADNQIKLMKP
jgi:hypothetical protein